MAEHLRVRAPSRVCRVGIREEKNSATNATNARMENDTRKQSSRDCSLSSTIASAVSASTPASASASLSWSSEMNGRLRPARSGPVPPRRRERQGSPRCPDKNELVSAEIRTAPARAARSSVIESGRIRTPVSTADSSWPLFDEQGPVR
jgi:hypothetical protein